MMWIIPAAALAIIITLFIVNANRRKTRQPGGYGGGYSGHDPGRSKPDDREIEPR